MSTTQFQGESSYDAFISHNGLDIEEEQEFIDWCDLNEVEHVSELSAATLNMLYEKFTEEANRDRRSN